MKTIWIYNRTAAMSGHRCWDQGAIDRESDDIFELTGDDGDFLEYALRVLSGAYDPFCWRCALTAIDACDDPIATLGAKLDYALRASDLERCSIIEILRAGRGDWSRVVEAVRREVAQ